MIKTRLFYKLIEICRKTEYKICYNENKKFVDFCSRVKDVKY